MRKHRRYSIAFKRQVAEEYLAGESFYGLSRRHELSRTLIRMWVEKYEAGTFDEEAEAAVSTCRGCAAETVWHGRRTRTVIRRDSNS